MLHYLFEKSSCFKPWTGRPSVKEGLKSHMAHVPDSNFSIIGKIGDLRCVESKKRLSMPDPTAEVAENIARKGWNNFSFETLAERLTVGYESGGYCLKHCFAELEFILVESNAGLYTGRQSQSIVIYSQEQLGISSARSLK